MPASDSINYIANDHAPQQDDQIGNSLIGRQGGFQWNWETVLFFLLIAAAILTRTYDLESRVVSHDETSHVYFSWLFEQGRGYSHDPVTHGPFQFHIVALSYFLLGDSDTSARIPAVLFSIITVGLSWLYRRYLGRVGALLAGFLLLISPFLLYYGRYVRNEAFIGVYFMITLWSILRYLETGKPKYMYWFTLATIMHFITKETSFIFAAQSLLFVGFYFVYRVTTKRWGIGSGRLDAQAGFLISLILAFVLFGAAIGYHGYLAQANLEAAVLEAVGDSGIPPTSGEPITFILIGLSVLSVISALYFLLTGYGADNLRNERSFGLMLVQGTLVLPTLTPFLINFIGWKIPVNASELSQLTGTDVARMAIVVVPSLIFAILVGLWWNSREWTINAAIFWGIFTVFYTTFFTHGAGFFTGMVGSLGYWLAQQEVERGSQPWFYYALVQIPMYEFLPAIGTLLAIAVAAIQLQFRKLVPPAWNYPTTHESDENTDFRIEPAPTFVLLVFWTVTSLVAYSYAGEKMPWLTFHIACPMILLSAWGLNAIISTTDWKKLLNNKAWITLLLLPVFLASIGTAIGAWTASTILPFQGQSLQELSATATFIISLVGVLVSGAGITYLLKEWTAGQVSRMLVTTFFALLAVLTARTAFRAAYVNYDDATEYLVYAHSAPGVKIALSQIEDISKRLTGSRDLVVGYDSDTTYPYWWYLRNYPNQRFFGAQPTRDLRDVPVILAGESSWGKLEPIVANLYDKFTFVRIWWPNQDYFEISWDSFRDALTNPALRAAIFKIWLNRDYTDYAALKGSNTFSLENWQPSGRMRLYIRKDITASLWDYGAAPSEIAEVTDPYEGKNIQLQPDIILGGVAGSEPGRFQQPRGVAVAPDGSLYVADTLNNRIQHLSTTGEVLNSWGTAGDAATGTAPGGTFKEPWGIAVGPDGYVYVADTWNHRVQVFSADGTFVTMWGYFGQADSPTGFYGPRDIAVDSENRVYVSDTGNKRVVIFDRTGAYISQFGSLGFDVGQFDEPVGIALAPSGHIYVADTWNQRIQAFEPVFGGTFQPYLQWDIVGWYGNTLDNKPYLKVAPNGHVFVTDPEAYRILEFNGDGTFIQYWGEPFEGVGGLNLPTGLSINSTGGIWVADSGNHRIVHYTLPGVETELEAPAAP